MLGFLFETPGLARCTAHFGAWKRARNRHVSKSNWLTYIHVMQTPKKCRHSKVKRLLLLRSNGVHKYVSQKLGRGCGVGRGLGIGVPLGVAVGLGVVVAVAVGVDVGVTLGAGVAVGVAVGVTVAVGVGVGVPPPAVPMRRNTWSGAVCCNTAHVTLRIQTTQPVPKPLPGFCQAAPELDWIVRLCHNQKPA